MGKNLLFFLFSIAFVSCGYDYSCDYEFGDPSWNYSQVFHDRNHVISSGTTHKNIYLTDSSLMISFVCVNLIRAKPKAAKVSFASLFKRISIELSKPHKHEITVHVLAMHHGYLRKVRLYNV
ncbi:uncharacterized protein LOC120635827 [Pararge aegeria]|uniref:uncharacterized protein LOC120635827 n=1 Tax=Pararge aegeria TaxID=116150 RepID=UPI0019D2D441|nr:uncharacterized protein LOC120635827 [Pararge aegeria]